MRFLLSSILLILLYQAPAALAACAIDPDPNGHVTIPDSWTSIADFAFHDCYQLKSITIPDTVTSIGQAAFKDTAIQHDIVVPSSVTCVGFEAFSEIEAKDSNRQYINDVTITFENPEVGFASGGNQFRYYSFTVWEKICGVDIAAACSLCGGYGCDQWVWNNEEDIGFQNNQAQCTGPVCPAGVSGVKWCADPPTCTSPSTTGYQVTETNLAIPYFDVTVTSCATGYTSAGGTAAAAACGSDGQPYSLSGCVAYATACSGNTYESVSPSATVQRVCSAHTTCGYQADGTTPRLTGASSTTAGTCEDCDSGTYAPDGASTCLPHTTCGYQADGTTPRLTGASSTTAGTCEDCDSGTYAPDGTSTCTAYTVTCSETEYESSPRTSTSDRVCTALTVCTADQYENTAPTATSDRECTTLYDCSTPATSGSFVLTQDCQLSGEVVLAGDLDILGVPKADGSYPVITAAASNRHFHISGGAYKFTLKYLKMVDGNKGSDFGGSIYVDNKAATVNVSHCEFYNNRAEDGGGAIAARYGQPNLFFSFVRFTQNRAELGGAVYLRTGSLVDYSSIYTSNTASQGGGALTLLYGAVASFFGSSILSNRAAYRGGGIQVWGDNQYGVTEVSLSFVTLQDNIQTNAARFTQDGGGGLALFYDVTANIRECTFIENKARGISDGAVLQGNQILLESFNAKIPSITIVNTRFTHIAESMAFYYVEYSNRVETIKSISPASCSANPCTATPFTGTCTDLSGSEGVTCDYDASLTCRADKTKRALLPLPPPEDPCECSDGYYDNGAACTALTVCTADQYETAEPTATSDRQCTPLTLCTADQYETTAPTATSDRQCTAYTVTCNETEYESSPRTSTSDRQCTAYTVTCSETEYESSSRTSTSDLQCTPLSVCTEEEYETTAPTNTSDRICTPLSQCTSDVYETTAPTATSDRQCASLTVCTAEQYESTAATATSDRICTALTTCNASTEIQLVGPSATTDRVCGCAENHYNLPPCSWSYDSTASTVVQKNDIWVNVFDYENDGDDDIVVPEVFGNIYLYKNTQGDGSVWEEVIIGTHPQFLMHTNAVDMNADGHKDIVIEMFQKTHATRDLNWFKFNPENSQWTEHLVVDDNHLCTYKCAFGDFDQLNNMDIVCALSGVAVKLYLQNADAEGFTSVEVSTESFRGIASGDFDLDGDLDIAVAGSTGFAWFENSGDMQSWTKHDIDSGATGLFSQGSLRASDLDGDGDTDIFAQISDGDIILYENKGASSSSWTKHTITENAAEVFQINPVDLDSDGDVDVVTEAAWFENSAGDGSSWRKHDTSFHSMFAGNFDGDLIKDIAAVTGSEVVVYKGDDTCIGEGCTPCAEGTRLAGDSKGNTATECCVDGYQSAIGAACTAFTDTSGCNAQRKKVIEGTASTDASCGDTCAATQYASGTQCIDYITSCPAGAELSVALPDAQRTCEACPIGEYKTLNDASACLPCQDAYEVIPINATEGATDCVACDVATEYDHDNLAHTGCISTTDKCPVNFQLVVTAGNAPNLCEACSPGTEQLEADSTAQCKACAEGYFSSNGHACIPHSDIETQCYEEGKTFIQGTSTADAKCGDACPAGKRPKGNVCAHAVCANEDITIKRTDAGHPLRLVTEADCEGKGCKAGAWIGESAPASSVAGWTSDLDNSELTVSLPEGLYFYVCTSHANMVGAILAKDCKDIAHEHECRCNENHRFDGTSCAKCQANQCIKNEAAIWHDEGTPAQAGACTESLDCTSKAATQNACIAPFEDGGVLQVPTACCKIASGATRLLGDKKTSETQCCLGGFQSEPQAQCQTYLSTCPANKELVGGSADSDKSCSDCAPDETAENGEPCQTFAEKEFGKEVKPTTKDGIKGRIKQTSFGASLVQKRKQFQSIIKFLKQQIRALATKRIQMQKEELPLSDSFKAKMGSRTKIDVVVPKVKSAKLDTAQACDEADVDLKAQPDAYDISLAEGESGLICSGTDPVTKLEMKREGALHGEDVDLYDYACWSGSAWAAVVEVQSGGDYTCDGMKFYVNSLSGITCNVSEPVSSLDSSVVVGTSGADCGATIGDGQTCSYTCNENFVQKTAPACSADGFVPATCECPEHHYDNLDGTCRPYTYGEFDNATYCNSIRKKLILGTLTTDTVCGDTCSDTQFASGTDCIDYLTQCNKGTQLVGGTEDTDRYCENCADGFYQDLDNTAEQCKAYSVCDIGATEVELVAPTASNDRVCGCAENHAFNGTACESCANGTRLAGDPKDTATECCVGGFQTSVGATCTAYSEDASSCNALRKPFIAGDEDTDASCGATCDAATQYASGANCVDYTETAESCNALRKPFIAGDEDTDASCGATCDAATQYASGANCVDYTETASSCNALRKPFIAGDEDTDASCGDMCGVPVITNVQHTASGSYYIFRKGSTTTHYGTTYRTSGYRCSGAVFNGEKGTNYNLNNPYQCKAQAVSDGTPFFSAYIDRHAGYKEQCQTHTKCDSIIATGSYSDPSLYWIYTFLNCAGDEYINTATGTCQSCPIGQIGGGQATSCTTEGYLGYASGDSCIDYHTTAPAGYELILNGDEDTQHELRPCGIGTYKALSDDSACLVCEDGYEVLPIGAESAATGCAVCDVATEYDQDGLAHTGCIETLAHCPAGFQHIETNSTSPNICEYCPDGSFQPKNETLDQCQPYATTAADCNSVRKKLESAGVSKIEDDSRCAESEVCDADHYASGFDCLPYSNTEASCNAVRKTLIHGTANNEDDSACSADACSSLHYANGAECTLYANTAVSCNAQRLPFAVLGSENATDNSACAATTCALEEHASAYECVANLNTEASCLAGTTRAKGAEFLVSNHSTSHQNKPALAALQNGNLVAVWMSDNQDTEDWGIFGRLYDEQGTAIADEFQINSHVLDEQSNPAVAALSDGSFVVVWRSNNQDADSWGVYQQRYDAAGNKVGGEELVNSEEDDAQQDPHVAALDGSYVVVWQSARQYNPTTEIFLQRYDNAGNTLGSEQVVNTYKDGLQLQSNVAALTGNKFVVLWEGEGENDVYGIFAKVYDSSANVLKDDFLVNNITAGYQEFVEAKGIEEGGFVAAWKDGSNLIYARAFDSSFEARGDNFVLQSSINRQEHVSLEAIPDGGFLAAWQERDPATSTYDIMAKRFTKTLTAQADAFMVNDHTSNQQKMPSLALLSNNQLFVAWQSKAQDNTIYESIYAKQYTIGEANSRVIYSTHNDSDNSQCQVCLHQTEIADKDECKCSEDHYFTGDACAVCTSGTRLAGDSKSTTTQCCVDGYQSAVGGGCIDYSEDAQSCNALRRPLIEGTASQDASCGALCDEATQFAQGTECVDFIDFCLVGFELNGGTNDTQKTCQACQAGHYKSINGSSACLPHTTCLEGTEIQTLAPSTKNDRICGCAVNHYFNGTICKACEQGTRLAGDQKSNATQCCVGGYQSAVGGACIAFSEDAQTCNPLRRPLIEGDENTDAQCGELCDASTEFAQGTECVLLTTACPAGQDLQGASNDTDFTCTPCAAGFYKKEADGSQCIACQDGFETVPLDQNHSAIDCIICDKATEYDDDGLPHTVCIATHDKCHKSFQLIITNETRPNYCEECAPEHYQDLDNTTEQCKPWTVCDINSTEVELLAPSLANNRVCGCAEDHYVSELCTLEGFGSLQTVTTNMISKVVYADIDGDGKDDILGLVAGHEISWYKHNGGGSFGNQQIVSDSNPYGIDVGDFDGDGDMDVIATKDTEVFLFENLHGDGSAWFKHTVPTSAQNLRLVKAADFNNDGNTDFVASHVVSGMTHNIILFYGGNGIADFTPWTNGIAIINNNGLEMIRDITLADIDKNGFIDIVCGHLRYTRILMNSGTYNEWGTNYFGSGLIGMFASGGYVPSVSTGDFDGDGDIDVASVNTNDDNEVVWYENEGQYINSGTWNIHVVNSNPDRVSVTGRITAGDLDNDGDADILAVSHYEPYVVAWYENINNGTVWNKHEVGITSHLPAYPFIRDLDEDGNLDVVLAMNTPSTLEWYPAIVACTGDSCQQCASGTRLAGDPKTTGSQCCVDGYQSAITAECTAYSEDAASCNALRKPLIEGTSSQDAACAEPCDQVTEFAQGTECLKFITTCGPGRFLTGGSNDTQKTCDACPAATFKATNGSEACQPCAAGSEVSEDKTACTPCQIETHYDDDKSSATVCAAAVAFCQKGTQFFVTNRTTNNRCDPCPEGHYQDLDGTTEQCKPFSINASYCNALNKKLIQGTAEANARCSEDACLAGEEAVGTKCLCIENYHLVNGVCSACEGGFFRTEGDDKSVTQNTNCSESGCFVLPNFQDEQYAVGQGECTGNLTHGQTCKLECEAGHQSYAYSCSKGILTAPSMACSRCQKYQHSVDGVCQDDTAYVACNCTTPQCAESGDLFFSIGRYDRDDSECRQATWVEEQLGQEVERPTTDTGIKEVFQNMAQVFEAPVVVGNTTEEPTKEEKREQFQSIVEYIKDEIESLPDRRIEIPKEVMVLSDSFKESLGERESVELVIPKAKTPEKLADPISACEEKDVDLAAQEAAYDVSLAQGDTSLLCRGDTPVTKLEKVAGGFEYACFVNGTWLAPETIQHDQDYLCEGKKFYVNSHSGVTCPVTRPVSADNELIVTGTNLDCGLTLAEGESCQTECNANYVKVSEANCTKEGFQPAVCKCEKDGFSEDHFGNCKQCDIGSFSLGGQACQPWTIGAEDCNKDRKVFQAGTATTDATCGEVCPEGLVAEWDHCTDPNKKIHCDTLSWMYFSGHCCDSFDNSPTCLHQVDRQAVPLMQSLSYVKREDRTDCWEGDKIVFRDGGIVCEYDENSSVEPTATTTAAPVTTTAAPVTTTAAPVTTTAAPVSFVWATQSTVNSCVSPTKEQCLAINEVGGIAVEQYDSENAYDYGNCKGCRGYAGTGHVIYCEGPNTVDAAACYENAPAAECENYFPSVCLDA